MYDDAITNAITFATIVGIIAYAGLCIFYRLHVLWESHVKRNGFRVTAADFNGTDWDDPPLVSYYPENHAKNLKWLEKAFDKSTRRIVCINEDTDYAQWDVLTWIGIKRAMPDDIIAKTIFGHVVLKTEENRVEAKNLAKLKRKLRK